MLKIVINNSDAFRRKALSQELETKSTTLKPNSHETFLFDFQETFTNLYEFRAQDLDHGLSYKITLERKEIFACLDKDSEESYLVPMIACDLPPIDVQKGQEKVFRDEYLYAMVIIQFQLKVLEQFLLFCEDKDAAYLVLNFKDNNPNCIEIYQRLAVSQKEIMMERGEQTEIIIPTDIETYDEVIDFMDKVDKQFRQALWRDQRTNLAFREYLKNRSL